MTKPLDSVRLVTCAGPCGEDRLAESEAAYAATLHPRDRKRLPAKTMSVRVNGRPYCDQCRRLVESR